VSFRRFSSSQAFQWPSPFAKVSSAELLLRVRRTFLADLALDIRDKRTVLHELIKLLLVLPAVGLLLVQVEGLQADGEELQRSLLAADSWILYASVA